MTTIQRIEPPIPLKTPKGDGMCHFLIDRGVEHHLYWVVFLNNGEIWEFPNNLVRASSNFTIGRFGDNKEEMKK